MSCRNRTVLREKPTQTRRESRIHLRSLPGYGSFLPLSKIVLTETPFVADTPGLGRNQGRSLTVFWFVPGTQNPFGRWRQPGSRHLNKCIEAYLPQATQHTVQIIWQCGRNGIEKAKEATARFPQAPVYAHAFITRMDLAFAAADLVVTRAGAGTISELCAAGKACIFVPSPNVAEDHQTHNALALVKEHAGHIVHDREASDLLMHKALELLSDERELRTLSHNILQLSRPHAAKDIATLVLKL